MDSCQSGSVQSSSGGGGGDQDEYDSRTQTLAAFFNPITNSATTTATRFIPQPPLSNHHHHHFDPDNRWPRTMRSDLNCNQTGGSEFLPKVPEITATGHGIPPARNPKKRSRASRRAPTTILTTDTANFRAMVQEFTGIPSPPFVKGGFDLFGSPPGIRSHFSESLPPQLPYPLLRPLPQKLRPAPPPQLEEEQSFLPTYQLPSELCLSNMQSPILTFQPLRQPPPKMGEYGSSQTEVNGLPNLVSSEEPPRPRGNADNQSNWTDGDLVDGSDRRISRGAGGGMVESWACSTD